MAAWQCTHFSLLCGAGAVRSIAVRAHGEQLQTYNAPWDPANLDLLPTCQRMIPENL